MGSAADAEASPKPGDHWHAAYGFYVCDAFQPPVVDAARTARASTPTATASSTSTPSRMPTPARTPPSSVFGARRSASSSATTSWTLPDGTKYQNGHDCNGQPAQLSVYKWQRRRPECRARDVHERLRRHHGSTPIATAFTFAVVPEGTDVPKPDSIPTLDNLSDVTAPLVATSSTTARVLDH